MTGVSFLEIRMDDGDGERKEEEGIEEVRAEVGAPVVKTDAPERPPPPAPPPPIVDEDEPTERLQYGPFLSAAVRVTEGRRGG